MPGTFSVRFILNCGRQRFFLSTIFHPRCPILFVEPRSSGQTADILKRLLNRRRVTRIPLREIYRQICSKTEEKRRVLLPTILLRHPPGLATCRAQLDSNCFVIISFAIIQQSHYIIICIYNNNNNNSML